MLTIIILLLPCLLVQCTKAPEEKTKGEEVRTCADVKSPQDGVLLDLFVFNDGAHKVLDSYTRAAGAGRVDVPSTPGDKILVALANGPWTEEQLARVSSYEVLEGLRAELAQERAGSPVLSGEAVFTAAQREPCTLVLRPLMSKIEVTGLSVRLEGLYKGKDLNNVQAYLTDVNGSCAPMRSDGFRPEAVLNSGRLQEADLGRMRSPGLLYCRPEVSRKMLEETVYEPFCLYAYPNDALEESAGSPFTKLVIQGEVDGQTWYYPIPINRPGYGYIGGREGIDRNIHYVMDVRITGPGSPDPAIPVETEDITTVGSATFHPGDFITAEIGDVIHVWCEVYPESLEVILDEDLLDDDRERGIYDYTIDPDGHGVELRITGRGTGMVYMQVAEPLGEAFLCVIVVK